MRELQSDEGYIFHSGRRCKLLAGEIWFVFSLSLAGQIAIASRQCTMQNGTYHMSTRQKYVAWPGCGQMTAEIVVPTAATAAE